MAENDRHWDHFENLFRDPEVGDALLAPGDSGVACRNIRLALKRLGYKPGAGDNYDDSLETCVREFQDESGHRFVDGYVGPGTRHRLAEVLWNKHGDEGFAEMGEPGDTGAQVFLCYAREDSAIVDQIDQFLQEENVRVWRDTRDIPPGEDLQLVIRTLIGSADKVVVVHSEQSKARQWTNLEIKLAEDLEKDGRTVLIYLLLDDAEPPLQFEHRKHVDARGRTLEAVGQELLHGIYGTRRFEPVTIDRKAVLVPQK